MKEGICYLSGPMSGYPDWNYPTFHKAAATLRDLGFDVINPAETAGGATHLPRERFIRMDIGYLLASDRIILLPGWAESRGATLEFLLAHNLGLPAHLYNPHRGLGARVTNVETRLWWTPNFDHYEK